MHCEFCGKRTSVEESVGNFDLLVCNDCVNILVQTSKDICNSAPETAFEIIITMLIQKCGNVCAGKLAERDKRIEELLNPECYNKNERGV